MWNQATWESTFFRGMDRLRPMWVGLILTCVKESLALHRTETTEASGSITPHLRWMRTSMSASFTIDLIHLTIRIIRKCLQARIGVAQLKDALGAKSLRFRVSTSSISPTHVTLDYTTSW
jgi:hypothetical protein